MVVIVPHVPHVPAPPSKRAQHVRDNVVELVKILREKDPKITDADVLSGVQLAQTALRSGGKAGLVALKQLTIALWVVYAVVFGLLVATDGIKPQVQLFLMIMAGFNVVVTVVWLVARAGTKAT